MSKSPVDDPPGKEGYQGRPKNEPPFLVPDYAPGTNPPGTNPPNPPAQDPATHYVPGSVPGRTPGHEDDPPDKVVEKPVMGGEAGPHPPAKAPEHPAQRNDKHK